MVSVNLKIIDSKISLVGTDLRDNFSGYFSNQHTYKLKLSVIHWPWFLSRSHAFFHPQTFRSTCLAHVDLTGRSSLYWSFLGYCFYILKVYLCSKAELQKAREHHFLSYVTWKQSKKLLSLMHFQKSLHILKSHRFQLLIELSKWKPLLLLPWQGCLCYFSTLLSVWRLQCPNTIL